ncbi:rho GTPase-activating protein 2-like isoform X2 [Magnolia sinica]|uniref:rho GTPase-activating protein 2-like isoform X2 n=1 Tax=Magnolia sinica TaxID=86752 RepID=UPI0026598769|nr:rho GTPase-activating protein 2-like isoform X2 [Magnolia sinica]
MTGVMMVTKGCRGEGGGKRRKGDDEQNQLSLVELLLAAIRRSMVSCRVDRRDEVASAVNQMDIGWPTNVRHVAHVTFDRFNGFLGLPVEFELEVPRRVPSASASVFGVSAESMQCSYDSKGNSVPTILLLMQERLYSQGGLKAEGIFRINPENSKEENVRDQLNRGIVPDDIDVHCLAGLIKAWFRELPAGVLDGLSPEQVLQCNTEEESVELVKLLLPTQAALLNWAVDLMADVVEEEEANKMNARNIAMVFAPNMTQMADPLTALMHAVQVMNLLKTLILKTLREREETGTGGSSPFSSTSSDMRADEDFNSQHEAEDMSCELRGPTSDDDHVSYSHSSEDDRDSLNDIEECFLRQLDGRKEDGLANDADDGGKEDRLANDADDGGKEDRLANDAERLANDAERLANDADDGGKEDRLANDADDALGENLKGKNISPSSCSGDKARQVSCSDFNAESGLSISDSKNGSLSTSDGEDSGTSIEMGDVAGTYIMNCSCSEGCENVEMVEAKVESHGVLPCLLVGLAD